MIVVEGPDGAGKTTLVYHLSEKFHLEIGKRGVANRDQLYKVTRQDTYTALALAVRGTAPCIWDRLFISEFVYASVVGRPCEFNDFEREFVKHVMDALSFPMIVCLPPFQVVKANVEKVHQMKGVKEGLHHIYTDYERAPLPWPENTIYYDYTAEGDDPIGGYATLAEVEHEVEGYLEARKERQAWV